MLRVLRIAALSASGVFTTELSVGGPGYTELSVDGTL